MRAPPFPVKVGSELTFKGQLQVIDAIGEAGEVTLRCPLRNTKVRIALDELVTLRTHGEVAPAMERPVKDKLDARPNYGQFTDAQRETIARRIAYTRAAVELFPVGPKSPRLHQVIEVVARRLEDPSPPSPHSVYRWTTRYVNANYDAAVFMQDANATRSRKPRVEQAVKDKLRQHIEALLGQFKFATLHGLTDLALALAARDLGYITFVTKRGQTELVEEFIPKEEKDLRERATRLKTDDNRATPARQDV